ncbi:MAG: DnaB-like helicase C-terminal domain-containing protein [Candidatus Poseidoniales archaeon]
MAFVKYNMQCPECDSSRGYGIDDQGYGHCFKCGHRAKENDGAGTVVSLPQRSSHTEALRSSQSLIYRDLSDRKLTAFTCEKYGVGFRADDLVFPIGSAAKVRIKGEKNFAIEGEWKDNLELFGQERFPAGGKYVLVVEGELDAMSAYQMLGSKYPVVSVRNGAQSALKDCKQNYDYLDSFDEIIFNFDNDAVGLEAQMQCAELFSHKSKCIKAVNGLKDASDYLVENRATEYVNGFWRAERWTPDGIVAGSSLYDTVMKPIEKAEVQYPFDGLNTLTYGLRKGELVTITAGSGLGKSQFVREIIWHILQEVDSNIGLMFLEESTRRTGLSLMSLAANKPLHLPDTVATQEEKDDAFNKTLGTDRVYLFDHFGSTDVDNIINRVRYLAKVVGCDYVFVDHISIIVSAQSNGDERKAIDEIMTKLRMLVQETGISLVCVSHLKRPDTKGHEEGAATSLSQLRGSGSIAQLSDMVIGLERNGQADDAQERNTTRVRVLKNRFSGITGKACALLYNHETGRMREFDEEAL